MTRDESVAMLEALLEDALKRLADMESLSGPAFEGGDAAKERIITAQRASIEAIRKALADRGAFRLEDRVVE
jgi:hypothetical protein